MHSRPFFRATLFALGLVLVLTSVGRAAPPNRITSVSADSRTPLPHTVPPRVWAAIDLGATAESRTLDNLTLRFSMTAAQQAALTRLLADQQNPASPRYHQWLTPEQFGAQFGLSSADLAKVSNWLTSQGFTITRVARSSTFITFRGTVAQAERAFHTSIHNLNLNGEQHFANTTEAALPPSIAGVVATVTGLDNFKLKTRARVLSVGSNILNPKYTSSVSGGHFIAPGDFNTIYNVNPLLQQSINGTGFGSGFGGGYGIAIVGQVDISLADVAAFRTASGLPANLPTVKLYGPDPGNPTSSTSTPSTGDLAEAQLDVEWSGAVAPGAKIVYVNSTDVLSTSLPYAIDDQLAPIISISYGLCEQATSVSVLDSFNNLFQQANALGITIIGPSGDSGATECDYSTTIATQGYSVGFPASSPFVTSMGGTMFNEGSGTGETAYWSASNGTASGSAKSYIPEVVWNETDSNGLSAGGGGTSVFFAKPSWQVTGTSNDSDYARDVPDISLNSAYGHDGYLFCTQGSCTNGGYRNAAGNLNVVGGTSVAAPAFAGILALVQQKNGLNGIGNANPYLYGLGNNPAYANSFNDVTGGNNNSPCQTGTPDCPNGGSIGYSAGPGYDLATGWGSVNVANLANNWALSTPATDIDKYPRYISATTLTSSSPICGISGGTLPLSVTVTNDTLDGNGRPETGPVPTGTVQFLVDNKPSGSPVTLSGGTATFTLNTSALSSGGHTVTAAYSGDTTYAGSRGTLVASDNSLTPIDVISSTSPDFSITSCTATTTAKSGGTAPGIIFTFTPVQGFTGTITLSVSASQSISAGYAFTPVSSPSDTVTINSSAPVQTTFTLSAYQSSAQSATAKLKVASNHHPSTGLPWYIPGSGATLACIFLLVLPRRRRWGALLAVIISVGVVGGAVGCSSGGGSSSNPTNPTTPVITPATPGTYNITITAIASNGAGGNLVHHATVSFVVTQ
ncbi:MAG TPA: protease pro-enzyme activation domain-containing protein [Edaphobacter sp.]|nr:protease pro-enzyme activation domain-containing protein [Edaphobacter sp.]